MTFEDRFWAKVNKTDTCWLWTASVKPNGYGQFGVGSKAEGAYRKKYAHRLAYELLVGPIPNGMVIDHLCRVRHCVNPAHMEVVTQRTNVMRGESGAAERANQTHCKRGHPFDEWNTMRGKNGWRECRTCKYATNRAYAATHKRVRRKAA